jgi:hypothetical protein
MAIDGLQNHTAPSDAHHLRLKRGYRPAMCPRANGRRVRFQLIPSLIMYEMPTCYPLSLYLCGLAIIWSCDDEFSAVPLHRQERTHFFLHTTVRTTACYKFPTQRTHFARTNASNTHTHLLGKFPERPPPEARSIRSLIPSETTALTNSLHAQPRPTIFRYRRLRRYRNIIDRNYSSQPLIFVL